MRSVQSTLFALLIASSNAYAESSFNLTRGVSPISRDVYDLHMTIFYICVVIALGVFGAMFYAIIYHRKSKGATPAQFHSHPLLEITWTIVPIIILVLMAIPATQVLLNMNNEDKDDLTIKITGYQWKWHYEYVEEGVSFFSNLSTPLAQMQNKAPKGEHYLREVDNPLVLPIHKKIRFLITSNDVNHAWWVPDFGIKRDALAGFINEAWTIISKPGTYRGQCAELCGINHAFMPIVVVAMSEQGYKDFIAKKKGLATEGDQETNKAWTMAELLARGKEVYARVCSVCHQPTGMGQPPTFPALKGSKIATGPLVDHVNIVMNGKNGTAMQAFKSQLSDVELAAIISYERNAFGNHTGDAIQPVHIKALREGKSFDEAMRIKPGNTQAPATLPVTKPAVTQDAAAPVDSPAAPVTTSTPPVIAPSTSTTTPASATAQPTTTPAPAAKVEVAILQAAMARGEDIYLSRCGVCHRPDGAGVPPTFPALKGSPIATGPAAAHIDRVLHGKRNTAMQAFLDQLSDQELADVITYERNAFGNNTGSIVTPEDIKAARVATPQ